MLWAAFITGLIGSLHCTGMCGPLICAMPISKKNAYSETFGLVIYNAGRIFSYTLLGAIIGTASATISALAGVWFSYLAGGLLIAYGLYKLISQKWKEPATPPFIRKWMGKLFRQRNTYTLPLLGMLNGIIPCGAVFTALAGASATGKITSSMLYMLVFGLATWPAMFASYHLTGKIIGMLKGYYKPITAVFLIMLGSILIYNAISQNNKSITPTEAYCN